MRILAVLAIPLALAACGKTRDVKMTDPRTGVSVLCESERFNVFTPNSARQEVNGCIEELGHYGFQDDAALRYAHDHPPPAPPRQYAQPRYPLPPYYPAPRPFSPSLSASDPSSHWYETGSSFTTRSRD